MSLRRRLRLRTSSLGSKRSGSASTDSYMNYKLLSLVTSCVLVILIATPIRGVDTPQLPLEVYAPEFAALLGERPKLELVATGFGFTEGPVYFSDTDDSSAGYLIFTDQLNDNINM